MGVERWLAEGSDAELGGGCGTLSGGTRGVQAGAEGETEADEAGDAEAEAAGDEEGVWGVSVRWSTAASSARAAMSCGSSWQVRGVSVTSTEIGPVSR